MKKKRISTLLMTCLVLVSLMVPALAADTSPTVAPVTVADLDPVISAITSQVTVANIISFLARGVGLSIVFVFFWWGVRKLARMIMKASRKGRLNI